MSEAQKPTTPYADLAGLTVEQVAVLAKFVQQAGGIERAQQAIESLARVNRAGVGDNARFVAENVRKAA